MVLPKRKDNDLFSIRKYSGYYASYMALFSSAIIFMAPEIVKILASENYWDAIYSVIPIVAGGYFAFYIRFRPVLNIIMEKLST